MKKNIKKIFIAVFLSFGLLVNFASATEIAIISVPRLLDNCPEFVDMVNKRDARYAEIDRINDNIRLEIAKEKDMKKKQELYNKLDRNAAAQKLKIRKKDIAHLKVIHAKLEKIIWDYMVEHNIDMVLDSDAVFFCYEDCDITDEIIKRIKKR